jgi:hypothetical protein
MILDASGRPITIVKKKEKINNAFDAFALPDGVAISAYDFCAMQSRIQNDIKFRERLEAAEKQSGKNLLALSFNRASSDDKAKVIMNMAKGEAITREAAVMENRETTLSMYDSFDRLAVV